MMGYDLLADVCQKAGVEDVEFILIRQVEIGGEGVGEDGDHLGMADAAVQGLHGQNHIGRDLDEILHILILVREALRDLLAVLEGILDADDLVGLDALPPAFAYASLNFISFGSSCRARSKYCRASTGSLSSRWICPIWKWCKALFGSAATFSWSASSCRSLSVSSTSLAGRSRFLRASMKRLTDSYVYRSISTLPGVQAFSSRAAMLTTSPMAVYDWRLLPTRPVMVDPEHTPMRISPG